MIIFEEEQRRLDEICARLWRDALATAIYVIDSNGQLITSTGDKDIDTTSLASLIGGAVAATTGLAQLFGEDDFPTHFHEGHREHLYVAKIAEGLILATIFDDRSSLGLVRHRVRKVSSGLRDVYADIIKRATSESGGQDIFGDITDDDIDQFFGDTF